MFSSNSDKSLIIHRANNNANENVALTSWVLFSYHLNQSSSFPGLLTFTHGLGGLRPPYLKGKAPWGRGCRTNISSKLPFLTFFLRLIMAVDLFIMSQGIIGNKMNKKPYRLEYHAFQTGGEWPRLLSLPSHTDRR